MVCGCEVKPANRCCCLVPCCLELRTGVCILAVVQLLSAVALLTTMAIMAEFATQNTPDQTQRTVRAARYLIDQTGILVLSAFLLVAGFYGLRATADRRAVVQHEPYVVSAARVYYGLNVAVLIMVVAAGTLSGAYSTLLILEWPGISQRGWAIGFVWTWLAVIFIGAAHVTFITWSYMRNLQLAAAESSADSVAHQAPSRKKPSKAQEMGYPSAGIPAGSSVPQSTTKQSGVRGSQSGEGKVYPGGSV